MNDGIVCNNCGKNKILTKLCGSCLYVEFRKIELEAKKQGALEELERLVKELNSNKHLNFVNSGVHSLCKEIIIKEIEKRIKELEKEGGVFCK